MTSSDSPPTPAPLEPARTWMSFVIELEPGALEDATSLLFELGCAGTVTLVEAPALVKIAAYFEGGEPPRMVLAAIDRSFAVSGVGRCVKTIEWTHVPDEDWLKRWKEGFEPIEIGERLVVAPPWRLPEETGGRVLLQMEPGMAFGTGTHETTRMCLEAIERFWSGGSLLDVGTGTGILAIAAVLLEPRSRIVAIDVDPVAVSVARDNAAANQASQAIQIMEAVPSTLAGEKFDIVVANLTAEVIVDNMKDLADCLAPHGMIILSGILTPLVAEVESALRHHGLRALQQSESGEWSAIVASQRT